MYSVTAIKLYLDVILFILHIYICILPILELCKRKDFEVKSILEISQNKLYTNIYFFPFLFIFMFEQ